VPGVWHLPFLAPPALAGSPRPSLWRGGTVAHAFFRRLTVRFGAANFRTLFKRRTLGAVDLPVGGLCCVVSPYRILRAIRRVGCIFTGRLFAVAFLRVWRCYRTHRHCTLRTGVGLETSVALRLRTLRRVAWDVAGRTAVCASLYPPRYPYHRTTFSLLPSGLLLLLDVAFCLLTRTAPGLRRLGLDRCRMDASRTFGRFCCGFFFF